MDEIVEYPKCLYRGEEMRVVETEKEEKAARKEGFRFWSDKEKNAD